MATSIPLRRLLRSLCDEVSCALDRNALDRARRGEARTALLHAWVVLHAPAPSIAPGVLARWIRRLDALLAPNRPRPRLAFAPLLDRLERRLREPQLPLVLRLEAFQRSVEDLASRTRSMVEHAERSARSVGSSEPPRNAGLGSGRREALELVWGEEE